MSRNADNSMDRPSPERVEAMRARILSDAIQERAALQADIKWARQSARKNRDSHEGKLSAYQLERAELELRHVEQVITAARRDGVQKQESA